MGDLAPARTRPIMGVFLATSRLTGLPPHEYFGPAMWLRFISTYVAGESWISYRLWPTSTPGRLRDAEKPGHESAVFAGHPVLRPRRKQRLPGPASADIVMGGPVPSERAPPEDNPVPLDQSQFSGNNLRRRDVVDCLDIEEVVCAH